MGTANLSFKEREAGRAGREGEAGSRRREGGGGRAGGERREGQPGGGEAAGVILSAGERRKDEKARNQLPGKGERGGAEVGGRK